ncbi:hypothetical protein GDO81_001994 [Engystomops pustulosus]|uniref:Secreted protein n=1 Tax=Engystomops pustulosus TaxID=76066 RepID=A0AAV7DHF3_ENGPU|nr:hypothetical protein GDO81_001994 [Engystomops pustulosus]
MWCTCLVVKCIAVQMCLHISFFECVLFYIFMENMQVLIPLPVSLCISDKGCCAQMSWVFVPNLPAESCHAIYHAASRGTWFGEIYQKHLRADWSP